MASLRNKKIVLSAGQQYDFPINGDSIRLVSAAVPIYFKTRDGDLDFYLEQGEKASFEGQDFLTITIFHLDGADQSIIISVGKDADVGSARFSGVVSISGTPQVTIAGNSRANPLIVRSLEAQFGSSYKSTTNMAANTPDTVFTPAANLNGAIVHNASFGQGNSGAAGLIQVSYLAKNSAPTTPIDGDVIVQTDINAAGICYGSLKREVFIPAGKGLYYISALAEASAMRSALYTLL